MYTLFKLEVENIQYKLALFDLDGTLLNGRSIFIFAEKLGFTKQLYNIIQKNIQPYEKSYEIAKLLRGIKQETLLSILRDIPFHADVETVIKKFKQNNITTAIATDGYQFVANDVRNRLTMKYAYANNLVTNDGVATGKVEIHNTSLKTDSDDGTIYSICKGCILDDLCQKLNIQVEQTIAVGDGMVDRFMIKKAGLGIAFNASEKVQKHADVHITNFKDILNLI